MQLNQLKPTQKKKTRKRIGRGGKRGTYSGRGVKGQKARAGARFQPVIRELIKKYPKLRGYRFKSNQDKVAIVGVGMIDKVFEDKNKINPQALLDKGLIRKIKGRIPQVKILANGETKKAFTVSGCAVSKQAKDKIEKAGGKVT